MTTVRLRCIEREWHTEFVELVPPAGVAVVIAEASHVMQWGIKISAQKLISYHTLNGFNKNWGAAVV